MADIVYLMRHAAPPLAQRGRYWGRRDPGVEPSGFEALNNLAFLAGAKPERLLTSPLARAAATAGHLARIIGIKTEIFPDIAEVDFGCFDGLDYEEIKARYPAAAIAWSESGDGFTFPGGENIGRFLARVTLAWRCCLQLPESAVMVVTHGGVIPVWKSLFLGEDLATRFSFRADYAALMAFIRKEDGSGWEMTLSNHRNLREAGPPDSCLP